MKERERAVFAAGCFWGVQQKFDVVEGLVATIAGYTGGTLTHPSYEQVCAGGTGHVEAVLIEYDKRSVPYQDLLEIYWEQMVPYMTLLELDYPTGQYQPVIFYCTEDQRRLAEKSKEDVRTEHLFSVSVTRVLPARTFWPAEHHHQHYHGKP